MGVYQYFVTSKKSRHVSGWNVYAAPYQYKDYSMFHAPKDWVRWTDRKHLAHDKFLETNLLLDPKSAVAYGGFQEDSAVVAETTGWWTDTNEYPGRIIGYLHRLSTGRFVLKDAPRTAEELGFKTVTL